MSKRRVIVKSACLLIVVTTCIFLNRYGYADTYYKYADKNGTVSFTDSILSIPEEYRKKAVRISDEDESTDKKPKENQIEGNNEGGIVTDSKKNISYTERITDAFVKISEAGFFRPVIAITIFLCLFVLVGKFSNALGSRQISALIRIVLTAGILIYLVHTYGKEVVTSFSLLTKDVTDITKKAEERNTKMKDAAKELLEPEIPPK